MDRVSAPVLLDPVAVVSKPVEFIPDTRAVKLFEGFGSSFIVPLPDGKRVAFAQIPDELRLDRIEVVLNWAAQLR